MRKIFKEVFLGIRIRPALTFSTAILEKITAAGPPTLNVSLITAYIHFIFLNFSGPSIDLSY